jgi:flagellar biosynthesis chaperone FliJ
LNENFNSFDEYEENLYENTENYQNKLDYTESDSNNMNTHSNLTNKYLNVINELIQTEKNYVQNLRKVVETYYYPLRQNHILNESELDIVFLNWQHIVDLNTKFYK